MCTLIIKYLRFRVLDFIAFRLASKYFKYIGLLWVVFLIDSPVVKGVTEEQLFSDLQVGKGWKVLDIKLTFLLSLSEDLHVSV